MADDALRLDCAAEERRASEGPIAPWWHTLAVLALMTLWVLLARGHTNLGDHVPLYATSMMMSWMLLGTTVAGVYKRRKFFFDALLQKGFGNWLVDAVIGTAIYIGVLIAMSIVVLTTLAVRHELPIAPGQTTVQQSSPGQNSSTAAPGTPAQHVPIPQKPALPKIFDQRVVRAMAPRSGRELGMWLLLSLTAGFCEELIFRGYLLRQAMYWIRRTGVSPMFATVIAVVVTALFFGSLHVYEGLGGAAVIAFLGLVYASVALGLGNLRAVIVAHALQDFVAGLLLFLVRHAKM